jgi:hypothetical protein
LLVVAGYELLLGPAVHEQLKQVVGAQDSRVRLRGLFLLASLVSQAPDIVRALHESGAAPLIMACFHSMLHVWTTSRAWRSPSTSLQTLLKGYSFSGHRECLRII